MKFKTIFILFNVVIVLSFLIIYFMPLFMLGWEYTADFWSKNWYLPVIFVAVIGGLNIYFIINWKLFRYLEAEDWDRLQLYLENQIYEKGRLRPQFLRVLVNAYLVKSEIDEIKKLDIFCKENYPSVRNNFPMMLSIPYFLSNDKHAMREHFKDFLTTVKGKDLPWVKWGYAFASFLGNDRENAKYLLLEIAGEKQDNILRLLTVYILDAYRKLDEQAAGIVDKAVGELRASFTRKSWEKEIEKAKGDMFIVILTKIIGDATDWLFERKMEAPA